MIYNKSVRMRIHINVEGSNFSIVFWFCRGYSILSLGDILSFLERKKKRKIIIKTQTRGKLPKYNEESKIWEESPPCVSK